MGASHCQRGGFTDRNVCNIHGEEIRPLGPLAAAGERVTDADTPGKLGNIYRFNDVVPMKRSANQLDC